jgi:hypothetical protein
MELQSISAALLFLLSIPVVMNYRILPIVGTPYWLFGILFFLLIIFSFISVYPKYVEKKIPWVRMLLFIGILLIAFGGPAVTAIVDRHKIAPVWQVHDIILQQEQAIRYFVHGKNPYAEMYFGTPVEMFRYDEQGKSAVNPALYHFVMPPWYLVFPLPFYVLANRLFGYFDGRMVLFLLVGGILFFLYKSFKNKHLSEIAIILISLSPATVGYTLEGRSDAFALFWLVGALFFLLRKRSIIATLFFVFAVASKQTMWFAIPLFGIYLFILNKKSWRSVLPSVLIGSFAVLLLFIPFIAWNAKAFMDSVILYLSTGGPTGYPISGYGLSMILYSSGLIKDLHANYPFLLWQLAAGIPTVILTLWFFIRQPSYSRFYFSFAVTLFAFWYTSRYFNNSHVAVIATLISLGILFHLDEKKKVEKPTA